MKKILSILLIACLVISMIPLHSHAEETCEHTYDEYGNCTLCGYYCPHQWDDDGWCELCGNDCGHDFVDQVCTICGLECYHQWSEGICTLCGLVCEHTFIEDLCTNCRYCDPNYVPNPNDYFLFGSIDGYNQGEYEDSDYRGPYKFVDGKLVVTFETDSYVGVKNGDLTRWYYHESTPRSTTVTLYDKNTTALYDPMKIPVPGNVEITFLLTENEDGSITLSYSFDCNHESHDYYGLCTRCYEDVGHTYVDGYCTGCDREAPQYYLVGYINGADYGCEDDYENLGEYKFENGTLTATFESDSYVFIKKGNNTDWYMTQTYVTGTTATFYNTTSGAAEKMLVPGGVEVTFTLVENFGGTLTLSYVTGEPVHTHKYEAAVTAPTCEDAGYTTYTCACGDSYTADEVAATGHSYVNGTCTACGAADPDYVPSETVTATLVTDSSTLAAGDEIVIVATGYDFALSTTQNTNNRGQADVTKDGNLVTFDASAVQIITLAAGSVDNTFALTVDDKYLYAPSSSSNNLKTSASLTDNGSWIITIDAATGVAAVTACGTSSRNTLRYNSSSGLFSCYAATNSQKDIAIYRIGEAQEHVHNYEAVVTAPTCEDPGYTTYTCACGDSYVGDEVAATGHSYVDGTCSVCGAADPDYAPAVLPTLTGSGFSLSFESEILVNFYYTVSDTTDVVEQGMLVFYNDPGAADFAKADDVYTDAVSNNGVYLNTTKGIAAKYMGDSRYYCAYAKLSDGTVAYSKLYQYSPKKYATNMLSKASTSAEQKALCVAMLNYGAAAQNYFAYKTDDLMNASLTAEQQALVIPYDATLFKGAIAADASKTGNFPKNAEAFSSRSATVSFEGAFAINYYFAPSNTIVGDMTLYYWTPADYAAAGELTAANATGTMTMVASGDGSYWGQVSGIAAKYLDETYYVAGVYTDAEGNTYCTGIIAYSLSRYCLNNAKDGNPMQELAANTAMYGYYAKLYFTK